MPLGDLKTTLSNPSFQFILDGEKYDHRKRKRNRPRTSCLNCYVSKRKCDKKRPCTRCLKLGTTGLCIYEVEDPVSRDGGQHDEIKRLRHRISELESVIRQLKNKPQPQLTASGGIAHDLDIMHLHRRPSLPEKTDNEQSIFENNVTIMTGTAPVFVPIGARRDVIHSCGHGNSALTKPLDSEATTSLFFSQPGVSSPVPTTTTATTATVTSDSTSSKFNARHYHGNREPFQPSSLTQSISRFPVSLTFTAAHNESISNSSNGSRTMTPGLSCDIHFQPSRYIEHVDDFPTSRVSLSSDLSSPAFLQPTGKTGSNCNCLNAPTAFDALVHLAITLRASREALEYLHLSPSDCILFCRVKVLEHHIFSVAPSVQTVG